MPRATSADSSAFALGCTDSTCSSDREPSSAGLTTGANMVCHDLDSATRAGREKQVPKAPKNKNSNSVRVDVGTSKQHAVFMGSSDFHCIDHENSFVHTNQECDLFVYFIQQRSICCNQARVRTWDDRRVRCPTLRTNMHIRSANEDVCIRTTRKSVN